MELIKEVGAFAGLAAFLGLAVLALLYFAQARDVRRLRENAEFLVEGEPSELPQRSASEGAAADSPTQPKAAARAAAASAPTDAEAFRRAELARQAAERRQRFETRRRGEEGRGADRLPSTAVMIAGAVILLIGIVFGASQLLGGEDEGTGGGGGAQAGLACPPGQTKVAVLNSTPQAGLAAGFAQDLTAKGYNVGPVSNTESPFEASTVMFAQGSQDCAPEIAPIVGIQASQQMDQEVRTISEGAQVAVVLGEDKAPGASSADSTETTPGG